MAILLFAGWSFIAHIAEKQNSGERLAVRRFPPFSPFVFAFRLL
jgi:hypothetical protein